MRIGSICEESVNIMRSHRVKTLVHRQELELIIIAVLSQGFQERRNRIIRRTAFVSDRNLLAFKIID